MAAESPASAGSEDSAQSRMDVSDPYAATRIKRGVLYLAGGKVVTAVAGIGTFLLLVRGLPVEQFAAYSILFGLVELVDAITGVGLNQVLSRYVPELFVEHRHNALRRLVALAFTLRAVLIGAFLAALYAVATTISPHVGLAEFEWALQAYLGVVFVRIIATSLFGVLESMLHQAIAQLGFGLITLLRFGLIAIVATQGALDLEAVILIEVITELVGFGVMLLGALRTMPRDSQGTGSGAADWIRSNLRRMVNFGLKGYLQHMLIMPFGGSTNRIVVGASLVRDDVALFGFAQFVADLMERYLPAKLLAGVIRPVLAARYVRDRRFSDIESAANLIFKLNAGLVCLAFVVIFAGGARLLGELTGGKYAEEAVGLLLLMCSVVLMHSLRHMLDHVCHAVERNGPLIWSNAVITGSLLPGIAMLPILRVYALPVANLIGLVVGTWVLVWRLRAEGFDFRLDIGGLGRLVAASGAAVGAAHATSLMGGGLLFSEAVAVSIYLFGIVALRPVTRTETQLLLSTFRRRAS